jgi:GNAT superfamily N-acetyltransferase
MLDLELKQRDGKEHLFLAQLNKTDHLAYVIVAYDQDTPIACGALRPYAPAIMEVKRMYVVLNKRGLGIASMVLLALEAWCRELNITTCVLETGKNQPEAIALYKKNGYKQVPNFGQYVNVENSVCFEKELI